MANSKVAKDEHGRYETFNGEWDYLRIQQRLCETTPRFPDNYVWGWDEEPSTCNSKLKKDNVNKETSDEDTTAVQLQPSTSGLSTEPEFESKPAYPSQPKKNKPSKGTKGRRNGFFVFMMEKRKPLEESGHKFPGGWKDVANFVSDEWMHMPQEMKDSYIERARKYNERFEGPEGKKGDDRPEYQPYPTPSTSSSAMTMPSSSKLEKKKDLEEDSHDTDLPVLAVMKTRGRGRGKGRGHLITFANPDEEWEALVGGKDSDDMVNALTEDINRGYLDL